jgi:hypothetical protein
MSRAWSPSDCAEVDLTDEDQSDPIDLVADRPAAKNVSPTILLALTAFSLQAARHTWARATSTGSWPW